MLNKSLNQIQKISSEKDDVHDNKVDINLKSSSILNIIESDKKEKIDITTSRRIQNMKSKVSTEFIEVRNTEKNKSMSKLMKRSIKQEIRPLINEVKIEIMIMQSKNDMENTNKNENKNKNKNKNENKNENKNDESLVHDTLITSTPFREFLIKIVKEIPFNRLKSLSEIRLAKEKGSLPVCSEFLQILLELLSLISPYYLMKKEIELLSLL